MREGEQAGAGAAIGYGSQNGMNETRPYRDSDRLAKVAEVACGRQSGKNALLAHVRLMRDQAHKLEALAMAIPDNFPENADAGLWEIVSAVTRR